MAVVEVYELGESGWFGWACECGEQQDPVLDRDQARAGAFQHSGAPHQPRSRRRGGDRRDR